MEDVERSVELNVLKIVLKGNYGFEKSQYKH